MILRIRIIPPLRFILSRSRRGPYTVKTGPYAGTYKSEWEYRKTKNWGLYGITPTELTVVRNNLKYREELAKFRTQVKRGKTKKSESTFTKGFIKTRKEYISDIFSERKRKAEKARGRKQKAKSRADKNRRISLDSAEMTQEDVRDVRSRIYEVSSENYDEDEEEYEDDKYGNYGFDTDDVSLEEYLIYMGYREPDDPWAPGDTPSAAA